MTDPVWQGVGLLLSCILACVLIGTAAMAVALVRVLWADAAEAREARRRARRLRSARLPREQVWECWQKGGLR